MRSNRFVCWMLSAVLVVLTANSVEGTSAVRPVRNSPLITSASKLVNRDVEVFRHNSDTPPHLSERIVGGKDADYTNHPYQLQLAVNGRQICGASIISHWWVLTAAHCLVEDDITTPPEDVTVRAGATFLDVGGKVHNVTKVIVHKYYDETEYDYDIALLKIKEPFLFAPTVQKVALPKQGEGLKEGTLGVVTGWGLLKHKGRPSPILQNVALPIISQKKCRNSYRKLNGLVTERMLCAGYPKGHQDFCQGDSGGPLVVNGKQVGIVSWSFGCGMAGFPGVFTRVAKLRNWIREKSGV